MKKLSDNRKHSFNPFSSKAYYAPVAGGEKREFMITHKNNDGIAQKVVTYPNCYSIEDLAYKYVEWICDSLGLSKTATHLMGYLFSEVVKFGELDPKAIRPTIARYQDSRANDSKFASKVLTDLEEWEHYDPDFLIRLDYNHFLEKYHYNTTHSASNSVRELLSKGLIARGIKPHHYYLHPAVFDTRNINQIDLVEEGWGPTHGTLIYELEKLQEKMEQKSDLLTKI